MLPHFPRSGPTLVVSGPSPLSAHHSPLWLVTSLWGHFGGGAQWCSPTLFLASLANNSESWSQVDGNCNWALDPLFSICPAGDPNLEVPLSFIFSIVRLSEFSLVSEVILTSFDETADIKDTPPTPQGMQNRQTAKGRDPFVHFEAGNADLVFPTLRLSF